MEKRRDRSCMNFLTASRRASVVTSIPVATCVFFFFFFFGERRLGLGWGARGLVGRGKEKIATIFFLSIPMTLCAPQPSPNLLSLLSPQIQINSNRIRVCGKAHTDLPLIFYLVYSALGKKPSGETDARTCRLWQSAEVGQSSSVLFPQSQVPVLLSHVSACPLHKQLKWNKDC